MIVKVFVCMVFLGSALYGQPVTGMQKGMQDQDDETDVYAIPLDSSEAEEKEEMEELQEEQRELQKRRDQR